MDDYYNHISDRQAKLYIISIAGVIVSIICAIILYPIFAVTSLDGALGLSDFLFYIFFFKEPNICKNYGSSNYVYSYTCH